MYKDEEEKEYGSLFSVLLSSVKKRENKSKLETSGSGRGGVHGSTLSVDFS